MKEKCFWWDGTFCSINYALCQYFQESQYFYKSTQHTSSFAFFLAFSRLPATLAVKVGYTANFMQQTFRCFVRWVSAGFCGILKTKPERTLNTLTSASVQTITQAGMGDEVNARFIVC